LSCVVSTVCRVRFFFAGAFMSGGYCKLFADIVDSSIWDESAETCKVWVTLLALKDHNGYVRGSPGWLAGKSRVSLASCEAALVKFMAPDSRSRTPDHEGRRIEQMEDGWLVLNAIMFADRLSNDPKSMATRLRVQKHRERYNALRNAPSVTPAHSTSTSTDTGIQAGVQGEKSQGLAKGLLLEIQQVALPFESERFAAVWRAWKEHRRKLKKPMTDYAQTLTLKKLPKTESEAVRWIEHALEKGWQGIYEPDAAPTASRNTRNLVAGRAPLPNDCNEPGYEGRMAF